MASPIPQTTPAGTAPGRSHVPELLAPAGSPDAALAALHYGADAVYLGLHRFSARAEAANFAPDEAAALVAYAHRLRPRRRVYIALNTVVLERETGDLADLLASVCDIGADAAIVQDLGVVRLARRWCPTLELHASTQMALHNVEGVRTAKALGLARVTLARELTLAEVGDICRQGGAEVEVFVHGALCYGYSGLCLFSSHLCGRSGNRGRCAYPCRDRYRIVDARTAPEALAPRTGLPFSMKDLALPDALAALGAAGVACLKIEGRMKSPHYVAAVTHLYRGLLDGSLAPGEAEERERAVRAVFSRPWTPLYARSRFARDVIDADQVGHRGLPAGRVVAATGGRRPMLRLRLEMPVECHDGLQFTLPGDARAVGFPVDELRLSGRPAFLAPAGSTVDIPLPGDVPLPPPGTSVFCASSQAVKRAYTWPAPPARALTGNHPLAVELTLSPASASARARLADAPPDDADATVEAALPGPFAAARDPDQTLAAARTAFSRLGHTPFALADLRVTAAEPVFVPASRLNDLRRELLQRATAALTARRAARVAAMRAALGPRSTPRPPAPALPLWSLKVADVTRLGTFDAADWAGTDEVVCQLTPGADLGALVARLQAGAPQPPLRIALPPITRQHERPDLVAQLRTLLAAGARRWEVANLDGWEFLARAGAQAGATAPLLDLHADWEIPVFNHSAAAALADLGITAFTTSPEDSLENLRALLAATPLPAVVPVYQDTPLFISENCPFAALYGCPGPESCTRRDLELESERGGRYLARVRGCRTVLTDVRPYCLTRHLEALRAAGASRFRVDLSWGEYDAGTARALWRRLRAGDAPAARHEGNLHRSL